MANDDSIARADPGAEAATSNQSGDTIRNSWGVPVMSLISYPPARGNGAPPRYCPRLRMRPTPMARKAGESFIGRV